MPDQHIARLRATGVCHAAIEKPRRLTHVWAGLHPKHAEMRIANRNAPPPRTALGRMGPRFAALRPPRARWRPHRASRILFLGCVAAGMALAALVLAA